MLENFRVDVVNAGAIIIYVYIHIQQILLKKHTFAGMIIWQIRLFMIFKVLIIVNFIFIVFIFFIPALCAAIFFS